jgi:hypothetical protein
MNLETRIKNLEKNLDNIIKLLNNNKFYTDADISGIRQSVSEITPYTDTKTAYYGEKEKTFYNVPQGNILVQFSNYQGSYAVNRIADRLTVTFEQLTDNTDITITIK